MSRISIRGLAVATATAASVGGAVTFGANTMEATAFADERPADRTVVGVTDPGAHPAKPKTAELARQQRELRAQRAARHAAARAKARLAKARAALASDNPRVVARVLVGRRGWSATQFACLDSLWSRESGWRVHAENGSTGAYGIPQALPGHKMSSEGSNWRSSAVTQISWGLEYIEDRYGRPCSAWHVFQDRNWY